jgi:hypothetical protein
LQHTPVNTLGISLKEITMRSSKLTLFITSSLSVLAIAASFDLMQPQRVFAQYTDSSGLPVSTGSFIGSTQSGTLNQVNIAGKPGQMINTARGMLENPNRWQNIASMFGLDSGTINQLLQSTLAGLGIPDLSQLTAGIFQGRTDNTAPSKFAASLENRSDKPSFSVKTDLAQSSERDASRGIAYGSVLSQQAQTQGKQNLATVGNAANTSNSLGQESQGLDVTQQIMQNLSAQMGKQAEIEAAQFGEAQQARIDRAQDLLLQSQISESITGRNVADRRNERTTARSAARSMTWLNLPGGKTLATGKTANRTNGATSSTPSALSSALGE